MMAGAAVMYADAGAGAAGAAGSGSPDRVRESLADHGIFSMLRSGLDTAEERRLLIPSAVLLLVAWLGFLAWIGPYVGSAVSGAILRVVPASILLPGVAVVLLAAALTSWLADQRRLSVLAWMLLAYHAGTGLSTFGYAVLAPVFDSLRDTWGLRFALRRAVYGVAVCLPMVIAYVVLVRRDLRWPLGFGDWRVLSRPARKDEPKPWWRLLVGVALVAGLPVFLMMQSAVGFAPIRTGVLLVQLPMVLLLSLINATAEEYIFRGFALPALVRAAGLPRALWLCGMWFGLHHFGLSVDILTSLPGALLLGMGSVYFGKSVVETRGMGWAIAAHAIFDIAIFAAFYGRI